MRTTGYSAANIAQFSFHKSNVARRQIAPRGLGLTALVLIRHGERDNDLRVSCTGSLDDAVWIPKAMLQIDAPSNFGFLVASMSKAFAVQQRFYERWIEPEQFPEMGRDALREANSRAARMRNQYRNYRGQGPRLGQNAFA